MPEPLYLVTFPDTRSGCHVTVRVREIGDSGLGVMFARLSGFVFDTHGLLVDPQQELLRQRFGDTRAFHVNRMSIISVEEISDTTVADLSDESDSGATVLAFKAPE